ncbi:MAG TPA: cytochrome c oxidase assembly protein [Acetobacteraceae bacterium]|nr:cytochrome c oxidase assembly protein [Acetobacteraceae bacterium]
MFADPIRARRFRKFLTVFGLCVAVGVMTTAVSYSVTLYRLFCQVTGSGGYTQRASSDTATQSASTVTVSFNTNVAPGMPWRFVPVQRSVTVHLGEQALVFFEAENLSDQTIVGHATFNVTPGRVGLYFKKIECFCFTEERLGPHQKVEMPVDFFVDPRMATDPDAASVHYITLSYTFFESLQPKGARNLARFENRPPDPAAGRILFATICSACHTQDHNKIGPLLAGVVGRRAGSVPGYPYSAALARSDITWTAATLNQWLAGPQHFIPGAEMPFSLPDAVRRRDVIAYLETLKAARATGQVTVPAGAHPG